MAEATLDTAGQQGQQTSAATPAPAASPGGSQTTATPSPSPASSGSQGSSGLASTPSTPGAGASGAPGAATAAEWVGIRDALKGMGLDLGAQYKDDNAALAGLAAAYRERAELQQLAGYGRQFLPHAEKFNAWMRQEQERAQAAEAAKQQWWKAPEFDPTWRSKIVRDPVTGQLKTVGDADPSIVGKYQTAADHQQAFLDKFTFNPIEAIKPGIEQVARTIAQELIQQHLGGYQEKVSAGQFIQANSEWLHARDQQGNVVRDPMTGVPQLSEWGRRFAGYVQEAAQMGLNTTESQQRYAMRGVQNDYLMAKLQGQTTQQTTTAAGDAAKQQFLAAAAGNRGATGPGAAVAGVPSNPNAPPTTQNQPLVNGQRGLQDLLLRNMAAAGFNPGQVVDFTR